MDAFRFGMEVCGTLPRSQKAKTVTGISALPLFLLTSVMSAHTQGSVPTTKTAWLRSVVFPFGMEVISAASRREKTNVCPPPPLAGNAMRRMAA